MKCYICEKAPWEGFNLYRQNPKGEVGIWACAAHSKPVEDALVRLVASMQKSNRGSQS